ncbi:isopeptide-forming domain-containing fimbrial protein [Bacillus sp. CDB3]|uniref:isopeptide-forming domain-containing fimbrial protein n=1 Tax=Bacillus sp. CDB3 TaxID=360310 RepID=UPI0009D8112E|nr:isopeptide-forming domain-containing fimbrial protein [Bacillus sp. CDB3]OQR55903.1 cell wall anchor protein [Bacillus sp. CDB3]
MKKQMPVILTLLLLLQLLIPGLNAFALTVVNNINHSITTKETANMCLREHEGKLTFQWPNIKKKVDLVIVQDASGSFANTIGKVKDALKNIVDELDPQTDRVMVTSYQDYVGYKNMSGKVLEQKGNGIKTIMQAKLNNNFVSAKAGIDRINPNSGTPTASGVQFALNEYEKAKGPNDPDRETVFLLITDGVANIRKDGYIYKLSNQVSDPVYGNVTSNEYRQDYAGALKEVTDETQKVKNAGYKLVTAFWEDKKFLSASNQYYDKYDKEVGPYARQELQKMATKPEWFVLSNDIEEFTKNLIETVTKVTKKEKDRMVLDFNKDLQVLDFNVSGPNGYTKKPILKDNQLVWDLDGEPEGSYTLTYKVKESKPQTKDFDVASGYFMSYDQKVTIPSTKAKGNPNATKCLNEVTKKVSDLDQKQVDSASLTTIDEEFTYDVNFNFGYDVESKKKIVLQDDLEDILDIVSAKLTNAKGETIPVQPVIDKEKANVIYNLPMQNNSYAYLAGQQYKLTIQAKIKQGTSIEVLKRYITTGGIPNTAQLVLDNNPTISNEVKVIPPIEEPKLRKTVSDSDEKDVEKATLSNLQEKFTWNVVYEFGNNPSSFNSIVLQDDVEDILDVVNVKVVNKKGEVVNISPEIDQVTKKVTVEIPKKDSSYKYLTGEVYTLQITSKIGDNVLPSEIAKYVVKGGIPNKAELVLDNKPFVSNEVKVVPPKEESKVSKTVSDKDEKNVEKATLKVRNEEFTWNVNYKFGNDVAGLGKVVLQDDVEDILDILEVKLVNAKGEVVEVKPQIDEKTKKVTVELPKKDEGYSYLAGQTYTLYIKSKIAESTSDEEIAKYLVKGGVPNKAELRLDNTALVSNEVKVVPPTEKPEVTKTVTDLDEKNVEKATLQTKDEEFTWNVNYKFGNDVAKLGKIVLQDDVEDILDIIEVKLFNTKGEVVDVKPQIDEKTKKVIVELPKKDESYAYLAGQTYTLYIKSKISVTASIEEISKYVVKGGIPNKAELLFDNKSTVSNEAKVVPPIGQLEIEKVDAKDANKKLRNAVFQVLDKDGKEIGTLTTDENGKAIFNQLLFGKYTIKEIKAPEGYMLLRDPIEVEITAKTPIQKIRVENTKNEWEIPETGGTGTTIFYLIGGMLMLVTVWLFLRKKKKL